MIKLSQSFTLQFRISQIALRLGIVLLMSVYFAMGNVSGQQLLISAGTQSACNGQFLDDSGTTGSYSNNNYTFTLCSSTAGQSVSLLFQGVNLGVDVSNATNSDYLSIYDGSSVNPVTLIGTYTGSALQGQTVQASFQNTSGCLTFVFQNGSAINGAGWEAQISCYTPCSKPTAVVTTPQLQAAPQNYGVMGCLGEEILFSGQSSVVPTGNTLSNYIWNFGDGSPIVNTSAPTTTHTYEASGQYLVHLSVVTNTGCSSTNATEYNVMVSSRPHFLGLPNIDPGPHLTCANPALLTFDAGAVAHDSWQAIPPMVVSNPLYLPDIQNVQFISTLSFDEFPSGATLTNCNQFLSVFANMEHGYIGDLDIFIKCPNGTQVNLSQSGFGPGYLGVPASGNTPIPGTGWDYFWSPTATNGTLLQNLPATSTESLPSGTYQASGNLCNLVGCPLNGDWSIHVVDNFSNMNGYIFSWGLNFDAAVFASLPTFTPTTTNTYWEGPFVPTGSQGAVFTAQNPTLGTFDYEYHVVTNYGCNFDSIVAITFSDPSAFTAGPDKNYTCNPILLDEVGILNASPYIYQWSWFPVTGLSNPNIANPTVNNLEQTTNYTVTFTPIGFPECAQTDMMTVNVVPSMVASLDDTFHGCAGQVITLPAPTVVGGVSPISYKWITPSGQEINQLTIDVIPSGVETYCVVVVDGCNKPDTLCAMVSTPPFIPASFNLSDNAGCEPFSTLMLADYVQVQNVTNMKWYFDDGIESDVLSSANHLYTDTGIYYPWLEITDIYGCVYRDTTDNPILVWPKPVSDFYTIPEAPVIPNTTVEFVNTSTGALSYEWKIGDLASFQSFDTTVVYPLEAMRYLVTLITTNQYQCKDSLNKLLEIKDNLTVFIPTSFTPNGDGINDVWKVEGFGFRDNGYVLRVFNRWGDVVFESFDRNEVWVGETNLGEYFYVPDGTYAYRLEVVDTINDVKHAYSGFVTVLR